MLTVRTYNNERPSKAFPPLSDVIEVTYTTGAIGGYLEAEVTLARPPLKSYNDLGYGYMLEIAEEDGEVVWEGLVTALPQSVSKNATYRVGAVGFLALMDRLKTAWTPLYQKLTDVAQIIRNGLTTYVPAINVTTTTAPNTGRTIRYTPGQSGSVREHLDQLIQYGNASNQALYWQIWNGRKFYLFSRPSSLTSADYSTSLALCDSAESGINGDTFYTRVTVRYRGGNNDRYITRDNTDMQGRFASVYGSNDPAASYYNYINEAPVVDATSHGPITTAQAQYIADTMLAKYSNDGVRLTASSLTLSSDTAILHTASGSPVAKSKVRAGKVLSIRDLVGASGNYIPNQSALFIGQTSYTARRDGTSTLDITAEDVQTPENLIAALLGGVPIRQG